MLKSTPENMTMKRVNLGVSEVFVLVSTLATAAGALRNAQANANAAAQAAGRSLPFPDLI